MFTFILENAIKHCTKQNYTSPKLRLLKCAVDFFWLFLYGILCFCCQSCTHVFHQKFDIVNALPHKSRPNISKSFPSHLKMLHVMIKQDMELKRLRQVKFCLHLEKVLTKFIDDRFNFLQVKNLCNHS